MFYLYRSLGVRGTRMLCRPGGVLESISYSDDEETVPSLWDAPDLAAVYTKDPHPGAAVNAC